MALRKEPSGREPERKAVAPYEGGLTMTRTRRLVAVALATGALAGANAERPQSCKSQGGPGNQP